MKQKTKQFLKEIFNMKDFWDYALLHKGATIQDKNGNEVESEFLNRMSGKYEESKEN